MWEPIQAWTVDGIVETVSGNVGTVGGNVGTICGNVGTVGEMSEQYMEMWDCMWKCKGSM